jgi:superfamily II DNA or RNA helicase
MTSINNYLGNKGYTIYKNSISAKEQEFLRKELTVKPFLPTSTKPVETFSVYRESNNKIYIPRYFAYSTFGIENEIKLKRGIPINLEFKGSLRDEQIGVVDSYLKHVGKSGNGLLELPCGFGKTCLGLYILSKLNVKTLIIVHKEFLLNQWITRIQEFLPNARVGKIQGKIIDIEDKDIVIGMLQSLSMKEYESNLFDEFGFTIIDETHHISAEVFVRSLFKVVTNYMLGLSATMNRKDGLTKVFKMFLGPIVYSKKKRDDDKVLVKAIKYISNDSGFNENMTDFRGNPAYSSMISKLCRYNDRSEFILKIVGDLIKNYNNEQIMILSHNKNLLVYLKEAIDYRKITTCGYYVGGMKEADLQISETKQVVLATYSMAAEALDIKTLSILIMATPKTDVTQSIGRILRTKHKTSLVIDIIDSHDIFTNQYYKRRKYYIQNKYKIITNSNLNYNTDYGSWEIVYEPVENKKEKKTDKKQKQSENSKSENYIDIIKDEEEPLKGKCLIKI